MPTSPINQSSLARQGRDKAGYSLLETLVALAIMALGAAFIIPKAAGAMDQVTSHAVFFDFQRNVSDLRRHAFRSETPLLLTSSTPASPARELAVADKADATRDGGPITVTLRSGWSYVLSQPMEIEATGVCRNVTADLVRDGKTRVHLVSRDGACHFVRLW